MSQLDPHQVESVGWLLRHPVGGLADEMRVGKTAPSIVAAKLARTARLFVLCPAIAVGHWRQQLVEWGTGVESQVMSYDLFARNANRRAEILQWAPDTVILDEFHYLRHAKSLRARAVLGAGASGKGPLIAGAARVWCLSGTPMPSHAGELWSVFHALFGETRTYPQWLDRYCLTRPTEYGIQVLGNRREALLELRSRFKQHFLRRTFAAIHGKDTEPLVWRVVPLGDTPPAEVVALEQEPAMQALVRNAREDVLTPAEEMALATLRRLTAQFKAPLVVEYVTDYLETNPGRKVLILGHHVEPLRAIAAGLDEFGAELIVGGTTQESRQSIITQFATNPTAQVVVGNIQACGVGIRLDAADVVMFLELDWVPGNNIQAAMRAQHRTKGGSVPVDVLSLAGSIDDVVARVRTRKLTMIQEVVA